MKLTSALVIPLLLAQQFTLQAAEPSPSPVALWNDYDPSAGDFKEQIVKQETRDGIYHRDSYISAYVLGEEIRVYCRYSVKQGAKNAPGLLAVHGWMGAASPDRKFVEDGWAVIAHDYCGQTGDRANFTKYPEKLRHGNMDAKVAGPVRSKTLAGEFITDPKQTSDYLWYAIQRRVLSYLEQQQEVDRTRLGAMGYSYGGTLMWNLATDARVKAVVSYFGIGYNDYYRDKQVWLYNIPYVEPAKSPGEEIILTSIAPEAHVPFITAATLFLNGSNDHHGGHERGLESFKKFPKNVPWSYAIQARGHHDTEKIGHNTKIWLEKHVLGKEITWPEQSQSEIRLDAAGVPELVITPASPDTVRKVEMYFALKNPCSFARAWRDTPSVGQGQQWIGKMPVLDVDDYVFGYANITYDTTIVRSTDFNAAIPAKLGNAVATDKPSNNLADSGYSSWSNIAELEGPKGIKGFRSTNNNRGSGTEQLQDPKWQAPANSQLKFKFYCTEPQTVVLAAADHNTVDLEITACDDWQEMTIAPERLVNRFSQKPMTDWSKVGKIHFLPKQGSDPTKVIFADFQWVPLTMSSVTSRDDAAWLKQTGTLIFQDSFNRPLDRNGMKAIGNGWESATADRAPHVKQADLDGGILKINSDGKAAGHGVHIHHDAGFTDGGTTLRFRFPGLNKGESFTIGHVDRELKGVHAGHLCYAHLYQTNILLRDNKTGVSEEKLRARRAVFLEKKEKLPADLDALLQTKEKTVAWKADHEWHDLALVFEGDEMRLSIDGKLIVSHRSEGFSHPSKRWLSFSAANTVWISDVKIWKIK